MAITAPRGTADIMPSDILKWKYIEQKIAGVCRRFGFNEIRTPVFENTELFERGVGDTTDVVQKEMYTFTDKGGRSITLRPEGTAGVARAFLEHNVYAEALPAKLCYNITCYRYEKPQAGRMREFHQFGAECFGSQAPSVDAELITMGYTVLTELGIDDIELNINSIGCPVCRKKYNEALKAYFKPYIDDNTLCETCRTRFDKNPLRILDCKSPVCGNLADNAPVLLDFLCAECASHFEKVKAYLDAQGIKYTVDGTIVRGLDYYTKTVFEFKSTVDGTAGTVCGGGRYDGLIEELGGSSIPAIGFAMGIERIILALEAKGKLNAERNTPDVYIANIGEETDVYASVLADMLRNGDVSCERDLCERSLKAQMKYANKCGAVYSMVLGSEELANKKAILKNMETKEQIEVSIENADEIISIVKK